MINQEYLFPSIFLKLELLPKCVFNKKFSEIDFYTDFFDIVTDWAILNNELAYNALEIAQKYGLSTTDALHYAAANSLQAHEFITMEKDSKPFFKVINPQIKMISWHTKS